VGYAVVSGYLAYLLTLVYPGMEPMPVTLCFICQTMLMLSETGQEKGGQGWQHRRGKDYSQQCQERYFN
jgi:hypothetical protein